MRNMKRTVQYLLVAVLMQGMVTASASAFSFFDWGSPDVRSEAFETIATKYVFGLSGKTVEEKLELVMEIGEFLAEHAENSKLYVPEASWGETVLKFPYMDMNLDGVADEASCNVEFWHEDNASLFEGTGVMEYMAALPWPVAIYTDGNYIKASLRIPETSIRVFLRQEANIAALEETGAEIREDIEDLVKSKLIWKGFRTFHTDLYEASAVTEEVLLNVESQLGPITVELAAPSVSFPANGLTVNEVVNILLDVVNAPAVPDLNQDGVVDDNDKKVLPAMFQAYIDGNMSWDDMIAMMSSAPCLWNMGATFQQWKAVKVLDAGPVVQLSVCQPFYAQTALKMTGLYHQTIMPCRLLVWAEGGNINIAISNPEVFFALFFFDAAPNMTPAMQQLFQIFPTFVLNEMVTLVNNTMGVLEVDERMVLPPCNM